MLPTGTSRSGASVFAQVAGPPRWAPPSRPISTIGSESTLHVRPIDTLWSWFHVDVAKTGESQSIPVDQLLAEFDAHLARIDVTRVARAREEFGEVGFTKVGFLAPAALKVAVGAEVETLIGAHGVRRELTFG